MTDTVQCDHLGAVRLLLEHNAGFAEKNYLSLLELLSPCLSNSPYEMDPTPTVLETIARTLTSPPGTAQSVPLKLNQLLIADLKKDQLIPIDLILPRAQA